MQGREIDILLIEDNPGDIRLIQEALAELGTAHHLKILTDGLEATRYLRQLSPHQGATAPDLILLDLNLPKRDGREVLADIKADARLRRIPVVVLSSSTAEEDILAAYDNFANCYISKPMDLDAYFRVAESIHRFWIETANLPAKGHP